MRRLLGALLVSLAASTGASCDDGGPDDDDAATTTERPTTTSPETTTTSTSTTEPVPFDLEVRRAAIDLLEVRNDVFMHPDVARVDEYIADTCTCLERERGFIESFVRDGVRWTVGPIDPQGTWVANIVDSRNVTLSMVALEPAAQLVRADGSIVEDLPERQVGYFVSLSNSEGQWLINGLSATEFDHATISAILAEGTA